MVIDAHLFTLSQDGVYIAGHSKLNIGKHPPPRGITLKNCPQDGQLRTFHMVKATARGFGHGGWEYEEDDSPNKGRSWLKGHPPQPVPILRALILND